MIDMHYVHLWSYLAETIRCGGPLEKPDRVLSPETLRKQYQYPVSIEYFWNVCIRAKERRAGYKDQKSNS